MKTKIPSEWPVKVRKGNTTLTIYRTASTKNGKTYDEFKLVYYDAEGKRRFESFSDFGDARTRADNVTATLSKGDIKTLTLTDNDRLVYLRAVENITPTGLALDIAAAQFAEAHRRIAGRSLLEAVDFFVKRNPARLPSKTVEEAVKEIKAAKTADGASEIYLKDLDFRLGKLAESFHCQLATISAVEINAFLRALKCGGRSRNNYRAAIATLFNFAERQKYLPKGHVDFDDVDKAKEGVFEIEIFNTAEMVKLLKAAQFKPDDLPNGFNRRYAEGQGLLPLLVLGGFAGLRTAEVCRQKWSDINLERRFIRVTDAKGNTAQKRLVPISDNLMEWLLLCRRQDGVCCDYPRPEEAIKRLATRAGIDWKHNALRHSFISYRVAEIQDVAKVSLEAGNSPKMIFRHYREVVTPEEAQTWFSITPHSVAESAAEKVVQTPKRKLAA